MLLWQALSLSYAPPIEDKDNKRKDGDYVDHGQDAKRDIVTRFFAEWKSVESNCEGKC